MPQMERYSEPYSATGGLAAEGVLNQLGRPNIEPLEVLVREAVQNCWDAKRPTSPGITVEIGRRRLGDDELAYCRNELLVDPPPGLRLGEELRSQLEIMYFADFGTGGLGGPTRADAVAQRRDFVDFVRNIGQPPDKDLTGGSFGYGKAAFYIASRARTVLIDSLCVGEAGAPERRFMGCALGENFDVGDRPYTGRHWWGRIVDGIPEPLINEAADVAARALQLPDRRTGSELGTTVVVLAPRVTVESEAGDDESMAFLAEALSWNFWPRMVDVRGAGNRTMDFRVFDEQRPVRVPNPRTHQRLRDFVEAFDRLREAPGEDDEFMLDREVAALRPARRLGRLVVKKGPVTQVELADRAVPIGARLTADTVHHVALMRNAELVVRYLPGAVPAVAKLGYAGVFKCAVDVDAAFRSSEPPTHDDWVYLAVPSGHERRFVKIALERISGACRDAAGYDTSIRTVEEGANVPLGEFADALATLLPGAAGPGARSQSSARPSNTRRRRAPGRTAVQNQTPEVWVDGTSSEHADTASEPMADGSAVTPREAVSKLPRPQLRTIGEPEPSLTDDGIAVIRYPFELRTRGNRVHLTASVEIMSSDGGQVESEAPAGASTPAIHGWIDPSSTLHQLADLEVYGEQNDGQWALDVELGDEAMMRVDLRADPV
jgi:hypothetical protein